MGAHLYINFHISHICKSAYYLLLLLLSQKYGSTETLSRPRLPGVAHAFITAKVDYCNSLFCGIPSTQLQKLQAVQNTAARIPAGATRYSSMTPTPRDLHWIPIEQRIKFKILVLVYKTVNLAPVYIQDMLTHYVPSRSL